MENIFNKLNEINVNDKIEKKGGLSYLSWAYAWAEVKKLYTDVNYTIYEREDGCFYHTDGKTCWVKTGVTINGIEHIEYLPVMDFKNRSITLDNVTSFDVNKTIQRSLTKALARHGLGLYIYAGEDLPENEKDNEPTVKPNTKLSAFEKIAKKYDVDLVRYAKYIKKPYNDLTQKDVDEAIAKKLANTEQKKEVIIE